MSRADLGFREAVLESFRFLELNYGFECVQADDTFVRFESDIMAVQVFHGRQSYEVDVEVIDLKRAASGYPPFHLADIMRYEGEHSDDVPQATTGPAVRRVVQELGRRMQRYGGDAAEGNPIYLRRLAVQREQESQRQMQDRRIAEIRQRAKTAWRRREYPTVIDLLSSIETELTASERKKLAYARGQAGA